MNKVFIAGRLTADPQSFVTQTGKLVSNLSVACQDNINKNEVYFFPCVAWQANAKFINAYLKKGDSVIVDGKLVRRSYVSKEGKNVYITEIVIDTIKPFGSRRQTENAQFIQEPNFNYNNSKYSDNNDLYFENNNKNYSKFENQNYQQNTYNENMINNENGFVHNNSTIEESNNVDEIIDLDWLDEI